MRIVSGGSVIADDKGTGRIHIILDAAKVNRCSWCGIPISDEWVVGRDGSFCSQDCLNKSWNEKRSNLFNVCGWLAILQTLVFPAFLLIVGLQFLPFVAISILIMILVLVCLHQFIRENLEISDKIDRPKDSRRNIGISEVSLLRSISNPVECPNCDGLIDLANIGEDMVYHCQYCGASGVLEIKLLE
jgi:hypothetical protein